jgi:hypothetical protein
MDGHKDEPFRFGRMHHILLIVGMVVGVAIGVFGYHVSARNMVEVKGWCAWSSGVALFGSNNQNRSGYFPTMIEHNGIKFDCIPRWDPTDVGTDSVNVTEQIRKRRDWLKEDAKRLDRLLTSWYETMNADDYKVAGEHDREMAASYIGWAEEHEARERDKRKAEASTAVTRAEEELEKAKNEAEKRKAK